MLQSEPVHLAPVLVRRFHHGLTPFDANLRGLRCASCSVMNPQPEHDSHALGLTFRVRPCRARPNGAARSPASRFRLPTQSSHPPLRFVGPPAYVSTKQRPTPSLPHSAAQRPEAFSASSTRYSASYLPAIFRLVPPMGFVPSEVFPSRSPHVTLVHAAPLALLHPTAECFIRQDPKTLSSPFRLDTEVSTPSGPSQRRSIRE